MKITFLTIFLHILGKPCAIIDYQFIISSSTPAIKEVLSPRSKIKIKEVSEAERRVTMKTKIMVSLFRQKELLKKDILRKRALLEKELQYEIQVSVILLLL